uniref:Mitochondrial fission factor n=1 Tax=Esox lucius TaxID=8010 RepID=A0AAY5JY40_ESOLU
MTSSGFGGDRVTASRDSIFSEAINRKMRVPDRLRVGPGMGQGREEERQWRAERPASYNMHIPDRLSLTGGSMAGLETGLLTRPNRHTVSQKYRLGASGYSSELWIGLNRSDFVSKVLKMSRRLAGLERQNAERRQTELVLFSLLVSACLLNGWLWIRR